MNFKKYLLGTFSWVLCVAPTINLWSNIIIPVLQMRKIKPQRDRNFSKLSKLLRFWDQDVWRTCSYLITISLTFLLLCSVFNYFVLSLINLTKIFPKFIICTIRCSPFSSFFSLSSSSMGPLVPDRAQKSL